MRRIFFLLAVATAMLVACDKSRVYEQNQDFENRCWLTKDQPEFEFFIDNATLRYNLYCDVRNEVSYPKSNLYLTYYLTDSTGALLQKKLISDFLFDNKTGEPFGSSGLGDIYDHQLPLLKNYTFKHPGHYKIKFEQFMRMDTLPGILAVGVRVENAALVQE